MSYYLDKTGLSYFWGKIKDYVSAEIPTKTSDLTNDSGFSDTEIDSTVITYYQTNLGWTADSE